MKTEITYKAVDFRENRPLRFFFSKNIAYVILVQFCVDFVCNENTFYAMAIKSHRMARCISEVLEMGRTKPTKEI